MKSITFVRKIRVLVFGFLSALVCCPSYGQSLELQKLGVQLKQARDSTIYVDILNRISFFSYMTSADSCLSYAIRAKSVADRLAYSKGRADALSNIGTAMYLKGLKSQSLALYTKALAEYQTNNDKEGIIHMLINSAVVYKSMGDSLNANKLARRALAGSNKLSGDSSNSMLYAKYELVRPAGLADSSANLLDKAEKIAMRYQDTRVILYIKQARAERFLQAKKPKEALPLIVQLIKTADTNKMPYYELQGLELYGLYFQQIKKENSAIVCYNRGCQLAEDNGFKTLKTKFLKSLIKAYKSKNDQKNVARVNALLVEGLEEEGYSNKNFVGDYIEYNKDEHRIQEFELQQENDRKMIYLLLMFSALALSAIVYILFLNKRLKISNYNHLVLNQQVTAKNELLKESDRFKAGLISMLAHDFRAPLTSTMGMMSVLKDEDFGKDELDFLYKSIHEEVNNTLNTFDNILQWVKRQYSGYRYDEENLLIHDLIQQAASMHNPTIAAKEISLVNLVPIDASIKTDKEIIQFINRNLIHNAVKFSPAKGNIIVSTVSNINEVIISIKDEGSGMTAEQQSNLFSIDKSSGSSDSSNPSLKGAGVALTICKEYIERLQGRIWSESAPEMGTTLFYAIPNGKPDQVFQREMSLDEAS